MRPKLVFCGPTISHAEAMAKLDAVCLPPAVQGSIVAAVLRFNPSAILIIDGGFQSEPAIKHKEILWALSRGIAVVGASSIGALRAAELSPLMIGVGLIYRWYRRYALAPDDAVAVLHGPPEINFAPLTDALIDLRLTFHAAHRQGIILEELARQLEISAQSLNFRDRTLSRVITEALPEASKAELENCHAILTSTFVRQKHSDALQALELVSSGNYAPPNYPGEFVVTKAFANDVEDAGLDGEFL
jgi:hypothetical protein